METKIEANRRRQAEYRARDIERNRKRQRDWARNLSLEKRQRRDLMSNRRRHGVTPEQYDAKLASQHNLCGLCGESFEDKEGRTPSLDHIHGTKPVRLRDFCHSNCNVAIGMLQDNPALCRLAAEYLERYH